MRKKYYLDTTILNFAFIDDDIEKREITLKFFNQLPLLAEEVYISDEVVREVSRAPEPRKSQLEYLLREINPSILGVDFETDELANRYIKEEIISERYKSDAIHIAVAVINETEVIVSWNFRHIMKLRTKVMVNEVNRLLGYSDIDICSPQEVIET